MAVTRMFGAAIKRREDPRLITGKGAYTDDVILPGMTHMYILRSPHGHALIKRLDTSRARQMPGVLAVLTAQDLEGKLAGMPCAWLIPNADLKLPPYPALAKNKVRYVGDGVAAVVAETAAQARDAAAAIEVEYEPLPAVVNQEKAIEPGAPQLHDEAPNNIAFTFKLNGGAGGRRCRQAALRQSAADPLCHGATRRGGAVEPGYGRADVVGDQPEPARGAAAHLPDVRHSRDEDPGHLARRRRWLREQDSLLHG